MEEIVLIFMTIHRTFEHYRNQNFLEKDFKTKASFNLCSKITPSLKSHDKNQQPAVKLVLEIPCSLIKPTLSGWFMVSFNVHFIIITERVFTKNALLIANRQKQLEQNFGGTI